VQIVRRELVVPPELAGLQIEGQVAIRIKVGAQTLVAIRIRMRVTHGPVEDIGVRVGAAAEPRGAAPQRQGRALPGVGHQPGITRFRDGPEPPHCSPVVAW